MNISSITSYVYFSGMPKNYAKVDNNLSRSAQPQKENLAWLKQQGVTDIVNLRVMCEPAIDFDEESEVRNLGMNYHNIPTITRNPREEKVNLFLDLIKNIAQRNGKAHVHCKAGADRTGLYVFVYKCLKGIGTIAQNEQEWLKYGHNIKIYPDLRNWAKSFLQTLK